MKSFLMRRASIFAVPLLSCTWSALAIAQGAPPPPPPGPPAAQPPPAPTPPPPPATPAVTTAAPAAKWYDKAKIEGFVDAYANLNFNMPTQGVAVPNPGRAFDTTNGFALHWAGLNASYAPDPVGGTVSLRFGPGSTIYNTGIYGGAGDNAVGLMNVKQAFASWKPGGGMVTLDFGKFDTWIGAEVADSQGNMNYTRSALFFTQPLFHTGLRLDFAVSEQLDIKLFAVNGWNNTIDNNGSKSFGASVGITPTKTAAIYVNYIGGPEQLTLTGGAMPGFDADASSRWRHLVDAVVDLKFDAARILVNFDYGTEKLTTTPSTKYSYYGGNLTLGYAVNDMFALAVRGGYLADPDGALIPTYNPALATALGGAKASIIDGTLTLAATPTPNLIIKLEPRIDSVTSDATGYQGIFPKAADADPPPISKTMFTTTLGIVATTN